MKAKLLVFFGIVVTGIIISMVSLTKCDRNGDDPNNLANVPQGKDGPNGKTDDPSNPGGSDLTTNKKETDPETPDKPDPNTNTGTTIASTNNPDGTNTTPLNNGNTTPTTTTTTPVTTVGGNTPTGPDMTIGNNNTTPKPPTPPIVATTFKSGSTSPEEVVGTMANSVMNKDFEAFLAAATGNGNGGTSGAVISQAMTPELKETLKSIIEDPNLKLDPERPFWEVAKEKNSFRWMLNFVPTEKGKGTAKTVMVDIQKLSDTEFKVSKVGFPPTLKEVVGSVTTPGTPTSDGPSVDIDSLTISKAFADAVLSEDFVSARKLSANDVTDERIAGLMIALEEGGFKLRRDRPLMVTFTRENFALVLSRVNSATESSEFALELTRESKEKPWKVNGLTFGKVIASIAKKVDGPYSPIVEDPTGGESLVVYFDFDAAGLTSRADNQLKIVASILNQDVNRKIRITGHADALGSDDYNRELSRKRAESIRQAIISRGANPAQVITEGYGETRPRKPNFKEDGTDNPTGRSENRRAEVYLDF